MEEKARSHPPPTVVTPGGHLSKTMSSHSSTTLPSRTYYQIAV